MNESSTTSFTDKNMKVKNIKEFWNLFIGQIDPEVTIEEILIRNNYISAKIKGIDERKRSYYYLEAGVLVESSKRGAY